MRSITAKAICTILATAMVFVLIYFVVGVMPNIDLFHPGNGTVPSSDPSTVPATSTTTPTVPPTTLPPHQHSFSESWYADESAHWNECSCGEKDNLAGHLDENYDEACDSCNVFMLHEHDFSTEWSCDASQHWNECPCGEQINIANHVDQQIDEICDICLGEFTHEHSFSETWMFSDTEHWHLCRCGKQADTAAHIDEDFNEECDVCTGYVQHLHSFDSDWECNEYEHWQTCACGEQGNLDDHITEDFDDYCDVCGGDFQHTHQFGEEWDTDETNHWHTCPCLTQSDLAPHSDVDFDEACDGCGMYMPHTHNFSTTWEFDENNHWYGCACGTTDRFGAHSDAEGDGICDVCAYVIFNLQPPTLPTLNGKHSFIYECDTNSYLYKSFDSFSATVYPASITKLFTCCIAMKYLSLDEQVLLGEEQAMRKSDASWVGLYQGQTVSVDALLHATLMCSGADATYALAAAAGRKILDDPNATAQAAVDAFMAEMNRQAKLFGMGDTNFVNPDGYHDANHKVSLNAFIIIAQCVMNNPDLMAICGKYTTTIQYIGASGQALSMLLTNSNKLMKPGSDYYIPESIGLKTGYTSKAGNCFLGLFYHEGKYVIICVLGCDSEDNRWSDMNALWNYYLEYCAYRTLT